MSWIVVVRVAPSNPVAALGGPERGKPLLYVGPYAEESRAQKHAAMLVKAGTETGYAITATVAELTPPRDGAT